RSSDEENSVANDRFKKGKGYYAVPRPLTVNYMPPKPDLSFAELDDSIYKFKISELVTSLAKDKNNAPETSTAFVEKPKEDRSSAPLIEDCETDSDDDSVFTPEHIPAKINFVKASDSIKHVKPVKSVKLVKPIKPVKTAEQTEKSKNFNRMAKKFVLPTNVGKGTGHRESRPVWNNVQRINHQNKFSPIAVITRFDRIPVSATKPKAAASTSAAKPVNTIGPKQSVNFSRTTSTFHKSNSPIRRSFYKATTHSRRNSTKRVNTAGSKAVSAIKGNGVTTVKTSAGYVWRPRVNTIDPLSKDNRWICTRVDYGHPQQALKNKKIVDSGCSRYMTGNKAYLADYQEIHDGGFVSFGSSRGKITRKGIIRTEKLDFDDVYFVNELKFNLFFVSQMCDKKISVLFTETECLVLSPSFKLIDESQVLLRVPRQNNMYSFDLQNVVPSRDLTCLFAKASIDESNLWHRRLGHVNFITMNKLVKGNLVRGLPSKIFNNDHSCVACQKGKQHKATLTDDFSKFSWVFFSATKDETSKVLKPSITAIENQINKKVEVIRCDNRTKFKNKDLDEFCGMKWIKREYSNATIPQQNRVTERENRTLIEVAKTMLADSLLPITFLVEAVNTACYVLYRALVTKTQNKTPYELLNGRTPRLDFMRPFGCPVTILNTVDPLGKFEGKADVGFLVGYSVTSKAFRVFNSKTRKVKENLHASSDDKPVDDKPKDDTGSNTVKEPVNKNDQAYRDKLDRLMSQEKEVSDATDALRKEFEQGRMDQKGVTKVGSTNSFNTVNDSQIPDLEDTVELQSTGIFNSAYEDDLDKFDSPVQSVGAEADFNNIESFTIVSLIPTHKVHIDHPKDQILGDPKSAIQTREMAKKNSRAHALIEPKKVSQALDDESWVEAMQEELLQFSLQKVWRLVDLPLGKKAIRTKWVYRNTKDERGIVVRNKARLEVYVSQPPGFIDPHFPNKVYKVEEALYGLHQAPRACLCDEFEALMYKRFQMSSIGELIFFLGLQVKQSEERIFISQDKYVAEILKKFDFSSVKIASTPIETQKPLVKDKWKKQTIVATSTTEAEYVAIVHSCGQVLWIQNQLLDYGFNFLNTKIYIDNESIICIVKNPVYHSKTKHIEIRHHFIRDSYWKKLIQVLKIHTNDNGADLLIKAFDVSRFNFLKANIRLLNM
nr:hypothetical protein [Tanacetum cinerariifolium]